MKKGIYKNQNKVLPNLHITFKGIVYSKLKHNLHLHVVQPCVTFTFSCKTQNKVFLRMIQLFLPVFASTVKFMGIKTLKPHSDCHYLDKKKTLRCFSKHQILCVLQICNDNFCFSVNYHFTLHIVKGLEFQRARTALITVQHL